MSRSSTSWVLNSCILLIATSVVGYAPCVVGDTSYNFFTRSTTRSGWPLRFSQRSFSTVKPNEEVDTLPILIFSARSFAYDWLPSVKRYFSPWPSSQSSRPLPTRASGIFQSWLNRATTLVMSAASKAPRAISSTNWPPISVSSSYLAA